MSVITPPCENASLDYETHRSLIDRSLAIVLSERRALPDRADLSARARIAKGYELVELSERLKHAREAGDAFVKTLGGQCADPRSTAAYSDFAWHLETALGFISGQCALGRDLIERASYMATEAVGFVR